MTKVFDDPKGHQFELFTDVPHTIGALGEWLDTKQTWQLFNYLMYGTGEVERIACLNALVRRELNHQRTFHQKGSYKP